MTYRHYIESFKEWLQVINLSETSSERMPRQLQEFFDWSEARNINSIDQVTRQHVNVFFDYIKYERKSKHTGNLLRPQTLNSYIRCLKLFAHYLEETQQGNLPVSLMYEKGVAYIRQILTIEEVQQLYQATTEDYYGIRERAILSVYYGCGLRSSEGIALNLDDVMLDQQAIYVRKGKGYKERYVPFVERQKEDFEIYLKHSRPKLIRDESEKAFFIGHMGKRITYNTLLRTLKRLQQKTENEPLKQKVIGLHALRHSIATHLMQRGMKFDYISQFLGHTLLSTTQIYTHLAHELEHHT
ncbi:MAG: tyrosine-type recombinase/integrase [Verrucomicrobia bacterium]|nr:tyrosine-type recombinase/integrase [Verrucomicrobiota bacterium]